MPIRENIDSSAEEIYTRGRTAYLENEIGVANKALPTVLVPGISGCDVTLVFAQMDNPDVETKTLQILEHNIIHRRSTGGS